MRATLGRLATASALLAALCGVASSASAQSRPPNIVLIISDDLGWRDVGFMGSTFYETPNIDALARGGMTFTAGYANAPNCAPTRASLMTGQYTPRHGIYTVGTSERGEARDRRLVPTANRETLRPETFTLAEGLRAAGFATAHVGKWHLGAPPVAGPEAQGFQVNVAGNESGHPHSYFAPYHNPNLPDGPKGEYLTDRLTREGIAFIDANRSRPFFLYLPYYAVHTPLQAKPELVEKYRKKAPSQGQKHAVYAAMIESMDQGVGQVMNRLRALGLDGNTVVIFTSDNGGHGNSTSNEPLRGSKGMFYEGGIRVPFAVRWPDVVRAGSRNDTPVVSMDLFPTLLEVAGAPLPKGQPVDGVSLLPLLRGTASTLPRESLFWHFPAYLQSYEGQRGPWRATPSSVVRRGDWKLIERFEDGSVELFNLRQDPTESKDLAAAMPERARELRAMLGEWRRSVGAPVPTERNPAFVAGGAPPERKTPRRAAPQEKH